MKLALIGASTIASEYMIDAFRNNRSDITHVFSSSTKHAANFAQNHQIPYYSTDLASVLAEPELDAVYISSTNEKHFAQAMQAIAAGKHVLCEKPLAMSLEDAMTMVTAAEAAGVVFATNHHLRCSGSHQAIRSLITEGKLGRILSLRIHHAVHLPEHLRGWRINTAAAGGGVIPDITVHDADVVRFLLGEDPLTVTGQMSSTGMGKGVEDSAMSVWLMPSGAMVMSHESFIHPFAGTSLEIHGTEASIFARQVMTQNPSGKIELVNSTGRTIIPFSTHQLYDYAVQRFIQAIKGEGQPAATGWDGIKSLAIALAVREAARIGITQTVDYGVNP